MRIVSPKRTGKASKRLDLTDFRRALEDRRVWAERGIVFVPDGQSQQWELAEGGDGRREILVDVKVGPPWRHLRCRLGTAGGSLGQGLWRVPAVGTEVAVLVPGGHIDFCPIIAACLESGGAPERVSDERTILVATDTVEITAPKVILGPGPDGIDLVQDGLLNGRARDPYTGLTHAQLGNASRKVYGTK